MNDIKVIKTQKDYEEALKNIEVLMSGAHDPESAEGEKLNLLVTLVRDYESRNFPIALPDPIEAIKFKMEQKDLRPVDLVPFIGSRSRVSEVLSGKRPLTLEMVRALESGLGIPASVLIQKSKQTTESASQWDDQLIKTMSQRGYFDKFFSRKHDKETLLDKFFALAGGDFQPVALLRKTNYRSAPLTDKNALTAWMIRILDKSKKIKAPKYKHGVVDSEFIQKLVTLSSKDRSPILAQEYLRKAGIKVIIEPHLPKTHLDGAAILTEKDNPVIGLTLRHDRLDNYWFTLLHELAHVARHYDQDTELFYDEIEGIKGINLSEKEIEADSMAQESLLPANKWEVSPARLVPSSMAANSLAKELGIHVALVAGQMRHRGQTYAYLSKIVSEEKVRHYFPDIKWSK